MEFWQINETLMEEDDEDGSGNEIVKQFLSTNV